MSNQYRKSRKSHEFPGSMGGITISSHGFCARSAQVTLALGLQGLLQGFITGRDLAMLMPRGKRGKKVGKTWGNMGKIGKIGKILGNHGETVGETWRNHGEDHGNHVKSAGK
jgi:hypothetical protein